MVKTTRKNLAQTTQVTTAMIILALALYMGGVIIFFSLLCFGRKLEEAAVADPFEPPMSPE